MNKFAFMIHPLDVSDVYRKFKLAQMFPEKLVEKAMSLLPPLYVSQITGIETPYSQADGWFVACPLTARQMVELPEAVVIKKIIQAGKYAEKLGAGILGLGAMTSVVGDAGVTVAKNLRIPVTTGNSYTVYTALEGMKEAARLIGIDWKEAEILVIGASGSIGSVCSRILARECRYLTLAARDMNKLEKLAMRIFYETGLAVRREDRLSESILKKADIILAVSSSIHTLINAGDLKPGALVCDVARPRSVSRSVAELRNDVLVIEGGLIEIPGDVNFHFNFGYPPNMALACMAETILLALENRWEHFTLGRELTVCQVEEMGKLAKKHGFKLAGFRSFERPVSEEAIRHVRMIRRTISAGAS